MRNDEVIKINQFFGFVTEVYVHIAVLTGGERIGYHSAERSLHVGGIGHRDHYRGSIVRLKLFIEK